MIALSIGQKSSYENKRFTGNRPCSLILAQKLDPYTMGNLLALYEHKVAFQGFIWGINSFDQEGVELGKKLASRILDQFSEKRKSSLQNTPFPLGEAFLDQLSRFHT
jgi:glucose-6-phosphate isomerase